ncbi:hypothetical protein MAL04_20045 (plasmid) [Leptospira noguchii]|nr:hypothetical protein MAL04_20045 [Leptospira noguchii]
MSPIVFQTSSVRVCSSPIVFQTSSVSSLSYSKQALFGFCSSPIVFQTSSVRVLFEPYRIPNKLCSGFVRALCSEPIGSSPIEPCSGSVRALSYSKQALFGFCSSPIVFQTSPVQALVEFYPIPNGTCLEPVWDLFDTCDFQIGLV